MIPSSSNSRTPQAPRALLHLLQRTANILGLEIARRGTTRRFATLEANFANLVAAYEMSLNEGHGISHVEPNATRVEIMGRLLGTPPAEAYHIVQALIDTANVPGDVCEFGVAQGETSALIANEIRGSTRTLHLFDSFEGLPAPTVQDELKDDIAHLGRMAAYEGTMKCGQDMVLGRLRAIEFPAQRTRIHVGFVEESTFTTEENLPRQVSFAYVDFDFYDPIRVTLAFLHRVLPVGGVVIVDDYDFFSTGVKKAVDEFVAANRDAYTIRVATPPVGHFVVLTRTSAR